MEDICNCAMIPFCVSSFLNATLANEKKFECKLGRISILKTKVTLRFILLGLTERRSYYLKLKNFHASCFVTALIEFSEVIFQALLSPVIYRWIEFGFAALQPRNGQRFVAFHFAVQACSVPLFHGDEARGCGEEWRS